MDFQRILETEILQTVDLISFLGLPSLQTIDFISFLGLPILQTMHFISFSARRCCLAFSRLYWFICFIDIVLPLSIVFVRLLHVMLLQTIVFISSGIALDPPEYSFLTFLKV